MREARAAEPDAKARCSCARRSALWRGSPLADLESETFAQSEIHRLEDLRLGVLEERIAADLDLGADAELVAEIEALVRAHPLRERLRGNLMLALYQCGRQAEALAAFHDARRTLRRGARDRAGTGAPGALRLDPPAGAARSSGSRRPRSRTTTTR